MEGLLGALAVLFLLVVPIVGFVVPIVAWIRASEAKRRVEELSLTIGEQLARTQQELILARRAFDELDVRVRQLQRAALPPATPPAWPVPSKESEPAAQAPHAETPLAEEPTQEHAQERPQEHAQEPTPERAPDPTPESTSEPTPEPTQGPTPERAPEPRPELTPERAPERAPEREAAPAGSLPATTPDLRPPATLEERIGLVWFTRFGAAALLLGVAYFFKYAVDNAWIGPVGRLVAGGLVGLGLLGFAEHGREKTKAIFTNMVVGAGLSVLLFAAYASHAFYEIVPASLATVAIAVISVGGGALAVRHRAEAILILSTCAALAAPVLLSTGRDQPALLFGYVGIVSVLAHVACFRGRFSVAPWVPIVGASALYVGWYVQYFEATKSIEALDAAPATYGALSTRIVPLGAVVLLALEWIGLSLLGDRAHAMTGATGPGSKADHRHGLGYVVVALLFTTLGLATLLFDHAVLLSSSLVAVAAVAAALARRYDDPSLLLWSELSATAAFAAMASRAPLEVVPVIIALLARAVLVCGAIATSQARDRAASFAASGLALLVLTASAAITLGPEHPLLFLGLLVALSVLVVAEGHRRDAPTPGALAMLISFPFLFVGAPPFSPLHTSAPAAPVDHTFLLLAAIWAGTYALGMIAAVFTKGRPATATPVLTSAIALLLFVGLVFMFTPDDAATLRSVLLLAVGVSSLVVGAGMHRSGAVGLGSVYFGLSLALFVASAALLLSGVSITLVWAALAGVLAVLAARERNDAWLAFAGMLSLAVVGRLLAIDAWLPERARDLYFESNGARGELFPRFLLHPRALSLAGTASGFFVVAAAFRRIEQRAGVAHVASFVGHAIALVLVVSEARHFAFSVPQLASLAPYTWRAVFDEAVAAQADAVGVVTTLALGSYAIAVLLLGFRARTALPRYVGLGLFLVALGKLGLYDIWYLPRIYQIGALVGTGALLLSASFLYARFGKRLVSLIREGTVAPDRAR